VLREYGNLAGASLPFILERIVSGGKLSRGDIVLMVGYGWGFSASTALLKHNRAKRQKLHIVQKLGLQST